MTAPRGSNGYLAYSLQVEGAVNIRNFPTRRVLPGLIELSLGVLEIPGHSRDHTVYNGTWQ